MKTFAVLSAAAVVAAATCVAAGIEDWQLSPGVYANCPLGGDALCSGEYETPVYAYRSHGGDFEERAYPGGSKLACSSVNSAEGEPEFTDVADYIFGENAEGMEIPMTSPVTTEIVPLGDGTVDRTMCFFLGTAFDDEEPPAPNDSDVVQITTAEPITIYTREFSGYMTRPRMLREMAALQQLVSDAGLQYEEGRFYTAGYDSPYMPVNRRNEIWLIKKD